MIIKNGLVFTKDAKFEKMDVAFENGKITEIAAPGTLTGDAFNAEGLYVMPGFVEIHSHGAMNEDLCDAGAQGLETMLKFYGEQGITSVIPATMSYSEKVLVGALTPLVPYFDKAGYGAVCRGINMEGPFISLAKKGAQNGKYIVDPAIDMFNNLYELTEGNIRLVDIAPERPGGVEFTKAVSPKCAVSIAHTEANYDEAMAAFEAGATHVTHLYNAMPPFSHRAPGVIGAASDAGAFVELIVDGFHIHPSVVRSTFRWFTSDKICLVSDSMRACGMPEGEYDLGGQTVYMKDGMATLKDGTIAASVITLTEGCRRAIKFGVPMEDAVKAATITPAKAVRLDDKIGSIEVGKAADFLLWNKDFENVAVFVAGEKIG